MPDWCWSEKRQSKEGATPWLYNTLYIKGVLVRRVFFNEVLKLDHADFIHSKALKLYVWLYVRLWENDSVNSLLMS